MRLAVFTSGRQDLGLLGPICRAVVGTAGLELLLLAGGMHWRGGRREHLDGLRVRAWIEGLPEDDREVSIAAAAGQTTAGLARTLAGLQADALLVAGDRSETLAAGLGATCLRLPLVHLHGGEETTGAIDNACRHALTRLAHLHFVAHPGFVPRLERWEIPAGRIVVTGAPALDKLLAAEPVADAELAAALGRPPGGPLGDPLVVLTHHPATLGADAGSEIGAVLAGIRAAIARHPRALVVATRPNVDAGGAAIARQLAEVAATDPRLIVVADLGCRRYWGLLARAAAMVGNSSSALLEAPCFDLPAVNVGARQGGRLRLGNVVDVPGEAVAVAAALAPILARPAALPRQAHPTAYGDGRASARAVAALSALARLTPAERLDQRIPLGSP